MPSAATTRSARHGTGRRRRAPSPCRRRVDAGDARGGGDRRRPGSTKRVEQELLQLAAVDGQLRPRVAGGAAARLPPDLLPVARAVHEALAARPPGCAAPASRPSASSSRTAWGSRLMPTPRGRTSRTALVHVHADADLVQAQRGHQPADAGPGDHRPERLGLPRFSRSRGRRSAPGPAGVRRWTRPAGRSPPARPWPRRFRSQIATGTASAGRHVAAGAGAARPVRGRVAHHAGGVADLQSDVLAPQHRARHEGGARVTEPDVAPLDGGSGCTSSCVAPTSAT